VHGSALLSMSPSVWTIIRNWSRNAFDPALFCAFADTQHHQHQALDIHTCSLDVRGSDARTVSRSLKPIFPPYHHHHTRTTPYHGCLTALGKPCRLRFHEDLLQRLSLDHQPYHFCATTGNVALPLFLHTNGLQPPRPVTVAAFAACGVQGTTPWRKDLSISSSEAAMLAGVPPSHSPLPLSIDTVSSQVRRLAVHNA
jgi:hypothetical protein